MSAWKQCPYCEAQFALQSSLNRHLADRHEGEVRGGQILIRARWPKGMKAVVEVIGIDERGERVPLNVYDTRIG